MILRETLILYSFRIFATVLHLRQLLVKAREDTAAGVLASPIALCGFVSVFVFVFSFVIVLLQQWNTAAGVLASPTVWLPVCGGYWGRPLF